MLQPSCRSTDDPTARRERLRHRLCIGAIRLTTNPRHSRGQGPHEAVIENSGGGKDPDFWSAFEDGEDRVIGDEPGNTGKDQDLSEEALSQG
jgi:hypothetical protein